MALISQDSDYDEYGPLVVDTSFQDDVPETSSSQLTPPSSTPSPDILTKFNKRNLPEFSSSTNERPMSPPHIAPVYASPDNTSPDDISPVLSNNESDSASTTQISNSVRKPSRVSICFLHSLLVNQHSSFILSLGHLSRCIT